MGLKNFIVVLLNLYCFTYVCESAPQYNLVMYPQSNNLNAYGPQPRPFSSIGDWITGSNWFPIEINIPETIGSISNGISGITGTISNGISGITGMAQRIPFINRLTSAERPRPLQYFVLIPTQSNDGIRNRNQFNPFAPDAEMFPHYP